MQTASTTELVRDRGVSVIASDLPPRMTLDEYRAGRPRLSRLQKLRAALLGAPATGLAAQSMLTSQG